MINLEDPANVVDNAIANGPLVEDDAGIFPRIHLDSEPPESGNTSDIDLEDADFDGTDPKREAGDSPADESDSSALIPTPASVASWSEVDFSIIDPRTWAPAQIEHESWMCRTDSKAPYAPWTDSDAPVECGRDHEDREGTVRCSTCDHAAGYKWGSDGSQEYVHADHDTAREWADMDPSLSSDLAFIQHEADPFAFVDGDDVRDPETGDIHPAFRAILEHLGLTYADVSTSGSGVHAVYRGEIPLDGVPQAMFAIDDEPFGANDDVPEVEIYDSKHVCIATGDHLSASGTEVNSWDEDALSTILRANGIESSPEPSAETSVNLTDHTPAATTSDETTDEIRDIFAALDRINAQRVAHDTIVASWNDSAGTSSGNRAFAPTWGPNANGTANIVNEEIWQDTGGNGYGGVDVMAAIDCSDLPSFDENTQPRDLNGADWFRALEHLRDLGYPIPELEPDASGREQDGETGRDLLKLDVVVDPAHALAAAEAVEHDDLNRELPPLQREDVESVAIAVAIERGWIDSPSDFPEDGRYTEAYYRARDHYGAPLPKYLDNTTLERRTELVFAALDRVEPRHILDSIQSEVTVGDPDGKASAKIDPTWEDSESGERILAGYGRGFYCVEHSDAADGPQTFDALQLVALEHGLVEDEFDRPRGDAFTQAYRLLRTEYDAPIPRWRATLLEHVAVLPAATRILQDDLSAETDRLSLADARMQTEALLRDAVRVNDRAQLVTSLPGTGKSYGTVAVAADRPTLYCTQRNDLKIQTEQYVEAVREDDEFHPDAEPTAAHLPILTGDVLDDEIIKAGVSTVRGDGFELLQEKEELLDRLGLLDDDESPHTSNSGDSHAAETGSGRSTPREADESAEDENEPVLERSTCPTAGGVHGKAWQVRLQVAYALGFNPADLHSYAEVIFGETLPCQTETEHDHHDSCEMSRGWDRVRDPDEPIDLLIGSPEHAFVDSATTFFERGPDGDREASERAIFFDEFPGEAFFNEYDDRYVDHAVWLAESLRGVDNREDLLDAGLESDTWVNLWIDGDGTEFGLAADAHEALSGAKDILDAASEAERIQEQQLINDARGLSSFNVRELRTAVENVAERDLQVETESEAASLFSEATLAGACETYDSLVGGAEIIKTDADRTYAGDRDAGPLYALHDALTSICESLASAARRVGGFDPVGLMQRRIESLPVGGDMERALQAAVEAMNGDAPETCLDTAREILEGGRDGCRALAVSAEDGLAHPNAWVLLAGVIARDEQVNEVAAESFAFDGSLEGGSFKSLDRNNARILADKNHFGALVRDAPSFTSSEGTPCPVIGLDATGRTTLWKIAIGRDTERRDIHETPAARRRFLRECMQLRVVQTSDQPLSYHSDPTNKNFQEDTELVRAVAKEYTGDATNALDDKGPAVLSTLKVLTELGCGQSDALERTQAHEPDEPVPKHAGATVNYENMKGSDALGAHNVGILLGSQHYGDSEPEKWALLAGESAGRGDTSGSSLDYHSKVANAYLRYMTEDHTMQAALRVGRNDEETVVFAHTNTIREDLPTVAEGAVLSAHSKGTLAVAEAAADMRGSFTAPEVAAEVADTIGERQVREVLSNLRASGHLQVSREGTHGRAYEYDDVEDPGLAAVELPDVSVDDQTNGDPGYEEYYSWNLRLDPSDKPPGTQGTPIGPTIPASKVDMTATAAVPPPE